MTPRNLAWIVTLWAGFTATAVAQTPPAAAPAPPAPMVVTGAVGVMDGSPGVLSDPGCCPAKTRGFLESDTAFPRFIGPISNPVLSKDPRSSTEARLLVINNELPPDHALGGGNFQAYALELRAAITDRLTLLADKDGIDTLNFKGIPHQTGLLNINAGVRYLLVRDVEDQFLWSVGGTYEPPTGERNVFENHGNGVVSLFTTVGKEVSCDWHALNTFGYQFGLQSSQNSSFFYDSLHVDRRLFGFVYPLLEVNWFQYTQGGDRGLPAALGEGDGLLNLGTSGVNGNTLVTGAVGVTFKLGAHVETGAAWEVPLTSRHDLIDNRLTFQFIARY